jgi:hypothetical protein
VFGRRIVARHRFSIIWEAILYRVCGLTEKIAALADPEGVFLLGKSQRRLIRKYLECSVPGDFPARMYLRDFTARMFRPASSAAGFLFPDT